MNEMLELSDRLVSKVSLSFKRYLFDKIDWNERLIGIKGSRGTGKTTMLLQLLKEKGASPTRAAYFSLDHFYFTTQSLWEIGKTFHNGGGELLVLDEVHKYPGWAREVKNLYDSFPDLQIIFTGSSIIELSKSEFDLSRRAPVFELPGLSYREHLQFTGILNMPAFRLDELIEQRNALRKLFPESFKPLAHFDAYLKNGYYPFYEGSEQNYQLKLQQLTRTIVEYDMAELKGFDVRNAKKLLQLLGIIVQNVPFKPNLAKLAEKSKIHRNSLNNYLHHLESARLIGLLYPEGSSIAVLQKPEKVFLNNTSLLYALTQEKPNKGTLREVFFYSQLYPGHNLTQPKAGDFKLNNRYTLEVGGKSKDQQQFKDIKNSFIVKDDLTYPIGNEIPLWLFGFLY